MRTEDVPHGLLLPQIPDFDIGVPASRDELIFLVSDGFYGEDAIRMVLVLVVDRRAQVKSLSGFRLIVKHLN